MFMTRTKRQLATMALLLLTATSAHVLFLRSASCAQPIAQKPPPVLQVSRSTNDPIPFIVQRLNAVEAKVEKSQKKPKDLWDKLQALSGLISGGVVALIGILATYVYNRRQQINEKSRSQRELSILQVQTVQSFMPQLQSNDPKAVEAAILSITALGNAKLATDLAALFQTEGAMSALSKLTDSPDSSVAEGARRTIESLFSSLSTATALVGSMDEGPFGCGFFVDSRGYLITLGFVIDEQITDIPIQYGSAKYNAQLVSSPSKDGLVMLKVNNGDFQALRINTRDKPNVGDEIYVLGPERQTRAWNLNRGIIEGALREEEGGSYIKARIHVEQGYAGSPAINRRNQVIGIVAMRDSSSETAYLLDTSHISSFLEQNVPEAKGFVGS